MTALLCYVIYFSTADHEVTTTSSCVKDGQAGVVTLLHNIIIAGDEQTRAWFAQYLKCMQQKVRLVDRHCCVLTSTIMLAIITCIPPMT